MSRRLIRTLVAALLSVAASDVVVADEASGKPAPIDLFEQRIMPIFRSAKPSSCVQCHLSAVDLKEYILPSHEMTFASLSSQGLIDLERPEKSKILTLIKMGEKDLDEGAKLIHEATRKAEYAAFAAWIKACCEDPVLRNLLAPDAADHARPRRPDGVIRHARRSRVVDSFARNVWSQRMRCFPCHTPFEIEATNPKHRQAIERVRKYEEEFGQDPSGRLRLFKKTPEATLRYLIERSRNTPPGRLPLINLRNPRESLMIVKPISKLPPKIDGTRKHQKPSDVDPVSHMGGLKIHVDDQTYKSFVSWLEDYARVVGDRYSSVDELPADNWHASKHVIFLRKVPEEWPDLRRVQLLVHAWDGETESWQASPIGFTQGSVTPRRRVGGALFLIRPPASRPLSRDSEDATLAPGKYLIKVFTDARGRLADDPTVMLGKDDFYGEAVIDARWRKGFRGRESITGDMIEKVGG